MTTVTVTVPPVTDKQAAASSWRKTINQLTAAKGGQAVDGEWLQPGDVVTMAAGTVVIAVDKTTTGWDYHYKTGERYAVQSASVTLYVADPDGLREQWSRAFKQANSALGATTRKRIETLLADRPALTGPVTVEVEAQRPVRRDTPCMWCAGTIRAGGGHLVTRGPDALAEHWQKCPDGELVERGTPCDLCGVTLGVPGVPYAKVMVREGTGRWAARHLQSVGCTTSRVESYEQWQERTAEETEKEAAERAAQRKEQERRDAAKLARKARKEEQERATHAAEQQRVANRTIVGRTEKVLFDKGLSPDGQRAQLAEVTCDLDDGTTTMRWVVRTYLRGSGWTGEDDDYDPDEGTEREYTRLATARAAYQGMRYEAPAPRRSEQGGSCDNCGRGGGSIERYDSSGIPGNVCWSCNHDPDYMLSFA
jgi:hypothetical protein